jgi:nitrite reductase (NADH) small subunit
MTTLESWVSVCRDAQLPAERGVAALVHGQQIAIFRTYDGQIYATDNCDPFTGVNVMSRGIVGTRGDVPVAVSPLHKQAFDLRTGRCLDDPGVSLRVFPVRCHDGVVQVAADRAGSS